MVPWLLFLVLNARGPARLDHHEATPQIRVGTPIIEPYYDAKDIRAAIRWHLPAIRYCYQKRLRANPTLEAVVALTFIIRGDGTVADLAADSQDNPGLTDCVMREVRTIHFPATRTAAVVRVHYPFTFRPERAS